MKKMPQPIEFDEILKRLSFLDSEEAKKRLLNDFLQSDDKFYAFQRYCNGNANQWSALVGTVIKERAILKIGETLQDGEYKILSETSGNTIFVSKEDGITYTEPVSYDQLKNKMAEYDEWKRIRLGSYESPEEVLLEDEDNLSAVDVVEQGTENVDEELSSKDQALLNRLQDPSNLKKLSEISLAFSREYKSDNEEISSWLTALTNLNQVLEAIYPELSLNERIELLAKNDMFTSINLPSLNTYNLIANSYVQVIADMQAEETETDAKKNYLTELSNGLRAFVSLYGQERVDQKLDQMQQEDVNFELAEDIITEEMLKVEAKSTVISALQQIFPKKDFQSDAAYLQSIKDFIHQEGQSKSKSKRFRSEITVDRKRTSKHLYAVIKKIDLNGSRKELETYGKALAKEIAIIKDDKKSKISSDYNSFQAKAKLNASVLAENLNNESSQVQIGEAIQNDTLELTLHELAPNCRVQSAQLIQTTHVTSVIKVIDGKGTPYVIRLAITPANSTIFEREAKQRENPQLKQHFVTAHAVASSPGNAGASRYIVEIIDYCAKGSLERYELPEDLQQRQSACENFANQVYTIANDFMNAGYLSLDIKATNFLLNEDEQLKLADKKTWASAQEYAAKGVEFTPHFMPPEFHLQKDETTQRIAFATPEGEACRKQCMSYQIGVMLYSLATGDKDIHLRRDPDTGELPFDFSNQGFSGEAGKRLQQQIQALTITDPNKRLANFEKLLSGNVNKLDLSSRDRATTEFENKLAEPIPLESINADTSKEEIKQCFDTQQSYTDKLKVLDVLSVAQLETLEFQLGDKKKLKGLVHTVVASKKEAQQEISQESQQKLADSYDLYKKIKSTDDLGSVQTDLQQLHKNIRELKSSDIADKDMKQAAADLEEKLEKIEVDSSYSPSAAKL